MQLILDAPVNSLSFGNVSYNILRELYRKQVDVLWFPTAQNADFSAFGIRDKEFLQWLELSARNAKKKIGRDIPTLKLWHLNGSESRIGTRQSLFSFYELDEPTEEELSLAALQDKLFFSSNYSVDVFKSHGIESEFIPLGFDEDFHVTGKEYLGRDKIHFGLMGKFEKRKHTENIIKLWLKKYGNDNRFQLTVCVTNPFYKKEEMQAVLANCLGGKRYTNINFLSYLKTNEQVNDLLNAIDIDLTGLSGAEGWNLPSFNATALGKWSIVLNETAHRDWATSENSILVESSEKVPCYDGKFFKKGDAFNQGNIFGWDDDAVVAAMEAGQLKKNTLNTEGQKLQSQFSYNLMVNKLLESI